jgi:hypothetical protein
MIPRSLLMNDITINLGPWLKKLFNRDNWPLTVVIVCVSLLFFLAVSNSAPSSPKMVSFEIFRVSTGEEGKLVCYTMDENGKCYIHDLSGNLERTFTIER